MSPWEIRMAKKQKLLKQQRKAAALARAALAAKRAALAKEKEATTTTQAPWAVLTMSDSYVFFVNNNPVYRIPRT